MPTVPASRLSTKRRIVKMPRNMIVPRRMISAIEIVGTNAECQSMLKRARGMER